MKRLQEVGRWLSANVIVAAICGCVTWESVPQIGSYEDESVLIELIPLHMGGEGTAFEGFRLSVTNKTDEDISLVWQKTLYVERGSTSGWFYFSGDRWTEINNPKPEDVVFPRSEFTRKIFPCNLVEIEEEYGEDYYSSGAMPAGENGIYLTFVAAGQGFHRKITVVLEEQ